MRILEGTPKSAVVQNVGDSFLMGGSVDQVPAIPRACPGSQIFTSIQNGVVKLFSRAARSIPLTPQAEPLMDSSQSCSPRSLSMNFQAPCYMDGCAPRKKRKKRTTERSQTAPPANGQNLA